MELARRTRISITFDGAEITEDVNGHILSLAYTDAEEGQTDDLQFVIDDRDGVWVKHWLDGKTLSRKSTLTAAITSEDEHGANTLSCGSFEVDSVVFDGPPCRLTIKGTSLPYVTAARSEEKSRTWEEFTFSAIAADICSSAGMELAYYAAADPYYEAADQYEETDMHFLYQLAQDAGLHLKVVDGALVVYDDAYYESAPVSRTIRFGESDIVSWSFETNALERVYSKCVVRYTDPDTGALITGEYTPGDAEPDMPILYIERKVRNSAEADALAEAKYSSAAKEAFTGSFSMMGDTGLLVGTKVQVEGFGAFDGTYLISSASHTVSGRYVTSISVKRCTGSVTILSAT